MAAIITAWAVTILVLGITVLPLVRSDFWTFRILEYPRLQKLVIGLVAIIILILFRQQLNNLFWWMTGIVSACCIYLLIKIYPYTSVSPKEMAFLKNHNKNKELKIFTANVLQTNQNFQAMADQISAMDPDIIFLVETDATWEAAMQLEDRYTYAIKEPLDNTYGLLFYSRLPIRNEQVIFRVDKEVPSVEAEIQLKSGDWVKVFGLHPKPPVPDESLYSTAKDKELMKVAFEVEKETKPCIVMGDLNDVAWSHVTELFRKVSGLLDPRRGRGFYSTFSANNWLMRFPLDYIFCSADFGLIEMKRMPYNGSDHFAMFIHLQYEPSLLKKQEEPQADKQEKEEAAEKATEEVKEVI